jgi:hypothetical protein
MAALTRISRRTARGSGLIQPSAAEPSTRASTLRRHLGIRLSRFSAWSTRAEPPLAEEDREEDAGDDKYFPEPTARHGWLDDEQKQQQGHHDAEDDLKDESTA